MLIADLADEIVDHAQSMAHGAIEALKRRPVRMVAIGLGAVLLMFRGPIFRTIERMSRATVRPDGSYRKSEAGEPADSPDKETSS